MPKAFAKPRPAPAKPIVYEELANFASLEAVCGAVDGSIPIEVKMAIRGKPVKLTGRRLRPAETSEITRILERELPPELPPEKEGDRPRLDFRDEGYQKRLQLAMREARALALSWCFPKVFGVAPAQAADRKLIMDRIENANIDEDVLALLWGKIREGMVYVPTSGAHVNFS